MKSIKWITTALLIVLLLLSSAACKPEPKPFPPPEGYSSWEKYQKESQIKTTTSPEETPTPVVEPESAVVEEPLITENPDFRNVNWGMSRADVKECEIEGTFLGEDEHVVLYGDIVLAGLDVILGYLFNIDDQLYETNYMITEKHSNPTVFISDFKNLKSKLVDKYGTPIKDDTIWLDDLYRDDPSDWGMAIVTGDLTYYCQWECDSIMILLVLMGDNYKVDFKLMYQNMDISSDTGETGTEGL